MMKAGLLGLVLAAGISSQAAADDLQAHEFAEVPPWTWTGCYVGVHVGGLWGNESWTNQTPGGDFFGESLGGHGVTGVLGGGQAGCDYQFAAGLVIGIQGEGTWTDARGSHPSLRETGVTYSSDVRALASVSARAGYAWGRFLGYVKGGVAWERDEDQASTIILGLAYRAEPIRTGWTLGAGIEHAFTQKISGFIEYSYYDFGIQRIKLAPQVVGLRQGVVDLDERRNVARIGINFRF